MYNYVTVTDHRVGSNEYYEWIGLLRKISNVVEVGVSGNYVIVAAKDTPWEPSEIEDIKNLVRKDCEFEPDEDVDFEITLE